jgi:hypothetical protein
MKVLRLAAILVLLCCSPILAKDKKPNESLISVISVDREIFYFRVAKQLLGGTVDVYDQQGLVVHSEKVIKKKMIVDFFHREAGTYTIKITKGEHVEVFECSFNYR